MTWYWTIFGVLLIRFIVWGVFRRAIGHILPADVADVAHARVFRICELRLFLFWLFRSFKLMACFSFSINQLSREFDLVMNFFLCCDGIRLNSYNFFAGIIESLFMWSFTNCLNLSSFIKAYFLRG